MLQQAFIGVTVDNGCQTSKKVVDFVLMNGIGWGAGIAIDIFVIGGSCYG